MSWMVPQSAALILVPDFRGSWHIGRPPSLKQRQSLRADHLTHFPAVAKVPGSPPHVDSPWKAKSPPYQAGFLIEQQLCSAGATGLEPAISGLTGQRVNHYTTPPKATRSLPEAGSPVNKIG